MYTKKHNIKPSTNNITTAMIFMVFITTIPLPLIAQETGIATNYPHDVNIASDPAVIFTTGFENGLGDWTSYTSQCAIINNPDFANGDNACLQITATRNVDTGGNAKYRFYPNGVDQLYYRFYCYFHEDTVHPHHFVNMAAHSPLWLPGGHAGETREGHLSYSTTIEPPSEDGSKGWFFYTYWHEMRSWQNPDGTPNNPPLGDGTSFYGNNFGADDQGVSFERERWICVEIMLKANTPGLHDGEQAFWVDGVKIAHWRTGEPIGTFFRSTFHTSGYYNTDPQPYPGYDWRTVDTLKLNHISLQWYVSDTAAAPGPTDINIVYFDDIVLATEYIGPRTTAPVYNLNVDHGSGSGIYEESEQIVITAAEVSGVTFNQWTGDIAGIDDVNSPSTTLTMPAADVNVAASYTGTANQFQLNVIRGSGSGVYAQNDIIQLHADDTYLEGLAFDQWTGSTQNIADIYNPDTTLAMPANFTSVTAKYKWTPIIVESQVNSSYSDAEEASNGYISFSSSDLELGEEGSSAQTVGMRFTDMQLPQGAKITKADVQFNVDESQADPATLFVNAELSPDAQSFTSTQYDISNRPVTTSGALWTPQVWNWVGLSCIDQQTPDIADVIQEIVDQPAWQPGNAIAIIVIGIGTRTAESFDGNHPESAPLLHIEYTIQPNLPELPGDYNGDSIVDQADYTIWADSFEQIGLLAADANTDGVVDQADYTIWADNYGEGSLPESSAAPDGDDKIGDEEIGKWRRYALSLPDSTYSGNPFEIEVDGTFTHTDSGTEIILPGYYAGNDTWKVGFMPTRIGEWTYITSSLDSDLNGISGSIVCIESDLPGMLKADVANPKKWKFTDGGYVVPMAFRVEFFFENASISEFTDAADFLKNEVKGQMYETRLTDEKGWYGGRYDYIFEGNWQNHQFDLAIWDQMEERMEILAERGLGAHIMFYSDDAGAPGWSGQSVTEALVIRYVVARLAGYPVVWFNTGIDISEYRTQSDVNWFGSLVRSLDPYEHPISSRYGGGSGSYVMSGQSFDSRGDRTAQIDLMTNYFQISSVPVSMDDSWFEEDSSRPTRYHSRNDIRRAFWKTIMAGGVGGLVRGGDVAEHVGYFSVNNIQNELLSEQWLILINPFIQTKLADTFGDMIPESSLVSNAYCIADTNRTKLLYFTIGVNDTYDANDGGDITVKLSGLSGSYTAMWFDPRSGTETDIDSLAGGLDHVLTPPGTDDWVLLLTEEVPLPGDYNDDGIVDQADYTIWADSYGQIGIGLPADGNGDGVVDQADYTIWADNYGQTSSP